MEQHSKPESSHTSSPTSAAMHIGQGILLLRRRAQNELSAARWRRMERLADLLEASLPAIEILEAQ